MKINYTSTKNRMIKDSAACLFINLRGELCLLFYSSFA